MHPRLRVLAALLALFTWSASVGAQVMACAPEAPVAASHHHDHPPAGHPAPAPSHPACPLAAAQACAVPALPSAGEPVAVAPAPGAAAEPSPADAHGRLAALSLFRPPRS